MELLINKNKTKKKKKTKNFDETKKKKFYWLKLIMLKILINYNLF